MGPGLAAVEGAVGAMGAATVPAVAEVATGAVVNAAEVGTNTLATAAVEAETVAAQGLAASAEGALATGGPDAALNAISGSALAPEGGTGVARDVTDAAVTTGRAEAQASTEDEIYRTQAAEQIKGGLSDEILKDPLFQGEIANVRTESQRDGRNLNPGEVQEEALARYLKQKAQKKEEKPSVEVRDVSETDKKIANLEAKITTLAESNEQLAAAVKDMTPMLQLLLEDAQKREKNEKKKKAIYKMLELLAALVLSTFVEVGPKVTVQPQSR